VTLPHLFWGKADCAELARRFGTPLYVMDESIVRARCAEIRAGFLDKWPDTTACYASKAFLTTTMARIAEQEGLGLDVASGGELHAARKAGFPLSRAELHGSAKSERELRAALEYGVGRIIVDGIMELELLSALAEEMGKRAAILLRIAPGVTPHTHAHLITAQTGGKFGLPPGEILQSAVKFALASKSLDLRGFHFHVGSQIFEPDSHVEAVRRTAALLENLKKEHGFEARELNFGGGFGVGKLPDSVETGTPGAQSDAGTSVELEPHVPLRLFTDAMMETLTRECEARNLTRRPAVTIEPGRWIAASAGITLYTVETVKVLDGVTYAGVDGGMPDNPRPSLYGAEYRAALANRFDAALLKNPMSGGAGTKRITIAGKCCETGDILVGAESLPAPGAERGDILAVFNTGAYNFSMASNYNRLPRPAVVLVKDGCADVIAERQTEDDLLRGDSIPPRLQTP
jgi:diaminopimelate decarboxylase